MLRVSVPGPAHRFRMRCEIITPSLLQLEEETNYPVVNELGWPVIAVLKQKRYDM